MHATATHRFWRKKKRLEALLVQISLLLAPPAIPLLGAEREVDPSLLPPPAEVTIDFETHIKPILEENCLRCHGEEDPKSEFSLASRPRALKGGDYGVDILPGHSAESSLIHYVDHQVDLMEMPPPGEGDKLSDKQIGLLRAWIDQGVPWSEPEPKERIRFSVSPMLRWVTVEGNTDLFQKHWGIPEGVSGGVQQLELEYDLDPETTFSARATAVAEQEDYEVEWLLQRRDLGFIRSGFDQYRRYYTDTGGHYAPFDPPVFRLDDDLHLDIGRVWVDVGLELPDWPEITVGYEYRYKKGTQSTLHWGTVDQSGRSRNVYPAFKDVDEQVHVVRLDAEYEWNRILFEDHFQGEFYDLETRKVNTDLFTFDFGSQYKEGFQYFRGANTIRASSQVNPWFYLSGGYLFSDLDGEGSFRQFNFMPSTPGAPLLLGDQSDSILLEQQSHVFNLNSRLGPWDGFTFSSGIQNEWTRQDGFSSGLAFNAFPNRFASDMDILAFEENFELRYDRIPNTVVFFDTRFRQEGVGHTEHGTVEDGVGGAQDFLRDTDATTDVKQYKFGFTVSPWSSFSISPSYRHRLSQNDYDHIRDTDESPRPGHGYPAYIRERDVDEDQFALKLVWKPLNWLKTTWKYEWIGTDYRTETDPSFAPESPGGALLAGNFDGHHYSLGTTFTPWHRWYLTTSFTYSDTRVVSGVNNGAQVVPFDGDIYTAHASTTFVLTETVDWEATYTFSHSDYEQDNETNGLPLGMEYDLHGITTGLVKRWNENLTGRLQYGYYRYDEPTAGGFHNYIAHAVLGSVRLILP